MIQKVWRNYITIRWYECWVYLARSRLINFNFITSGNWHNIPAWHNKIPRPAVYPIWGMLVIPGRINSIYELSSTCTLDVVLGVNKGRHRSQISIGVLRWYEWGGVVLRLGWGACRIIQKLDPNLRKHPEVHPLVYRVATCRAPSR